MGSYKEFSIKDLLISFLIVAAAVFASGLIPVILHQGYLVYPSAIFFGASAAVLYIALDFAAGNMLRSHTPAIILGVSFVLVTAMLVVSMIMNDIVYWSLGLSLIFLAFVIKRLFRFSANILVYILPAIAIILGVILNAFLPKEYGMIIDLIAFGVINISLLISIFLIGLPYTDGYLYRFKKGSTEERVLPKNNHGSTYYDDGDPSELEYLIKDATYAYSVSVYEHSGIVDIEMSVSKEEAHMASYSKNKARDICNKWARKNKVNYNFRINLIVD